MRKLKQSIGIYSITITYIMQIYPNINNYSNLMPVITLMAFLKTSIAFLISINAAIEVYKSRFYIGSNMMFFEKY